MEIKETDIACIAEFVSSNIVTKGMSERQIASLAFESGMRAILGVIEEISEKLEARRLCSRSDSDTVRASAFESASDIVTCLTAQKLLSMAVGDEA